MPIFDVFPTQIPVLASVLPPKEIVSTDWFYTAERSISIAIRASDAAQGIEVAYPSPFDADRAFSVDTYISHGIPEKDTAYGVETVGDRVIACEDIISAVERAFVHLFGEDFAYAYEFISRFLSVLDTLKGYEKVTDREITLTDSTSAYDFVGDRVIEVLDISFLQDIVGSRTFTAHDFATAADITATFFPTAHDTASLVERIGDRVLETFDIGTVYELLAYRAISAYDVVAAVERAYFVYSASDFASLTERGVIFPYARDLASLSEVGFISLIARDFMSFMEFISFREFTISDVAATAERAVVGISTHDLASLYEVGIISFIARDLATLVERISERELTLTDFASLTDVVKSLAAVFLLASSDAAFMTEVGIAATLIAASDSFYGIERAYITPYAVDVAHLFEVLGDRIFTGVDFASVFEVLGGRAFEAFAAFYGIDRLIQEIKEGRLFTLMFAFNAFAYASIYTTASYTPPIACEAHLSVDTAKDTDAILALFVADEEEKHPKDAFSSQVLFYGGALPEYYKGLFAWSFRDDSYVERDTDFDGVQAEFLTGNNYVLRILQTADKTIYEVFDEARNLICKKEYNKGFSNPMKLVISTCTHTDYAFYQIYRMKFAFLRKLIYPEPTVTIGEEQERP